MTSDNLTGSLFSVELTQPLAARLRPTALDDVIGQQHLLAEGMPLAQIVATASPTSIILWGPPGTGKTTLAEIVANSSSSAMVNISAVTDGVKEIRRAVEIAQQKLQEGKRTVVFVDEVHRFNKAQQDAFLPHIESGLIQFIGATTENPSFSLNSALLSRARLFILKPLGAEDLALLLERALSELNSNSTQPLAVSEAAQTALIQLSAGDGRRLLTHLELALQLANNGIIDVEQIQLSSGSTHTAFDKNGDIFYDHLSAFHKSVRGSSVDGALFYFARLIQAGCDATVIARRLLAIASEDIGNADPRALSLCVTAWDVYHRVGAAEGERAIAQAIVYCALAPKSNAVYQAFKAAQRTAAEFPDTPIPAHLRNAPTKISNDQGHGAEYRYAHNEPGAYAAGEEYLPKGVPGDFYAPNDRGLEKQLAAKQDYLKQLDAIARDKSGNTQ
ncbi:replication-associated recombination protein A [Alteromonas sp. ASW11-36]|uniref:Replication-associated recombination protein A n=1 Tax=Alteromonas arenosi TaxID=3055817 RepID=A0ABT7SX81_9ALTE|nr:replication-associated recombination protein A [Alteromonas sp. ASW11-36]MDM7860802.1 replication-associated recombination protein A [Alteromonas sp. ASW11-36]